MKKIEAVDFKKRCLDLLDNVDDDGLIITRDGVPSARIVPFQGISADHGGFSDAELIGSLRGKIKIKGDLLTTGCQWEATAED